MNGTMTTRNSAGAAGEQIEKTVRGTVKLAHEVFAENVEIQLATTGERGRSMDWFGTFTLPDRFNNSHLKDGSTTSRFMLSLDDGRSGQFRIRAFRFAGDEQFVVEFEGIGPLA